MSRLVDFGNQSDRIGSGGRGKYIHYIIKGTFMKKYKISEVSSKLEIQCKQDVDFHLVVLGIPCSMIMSVKNWTRVRAESFT